MLLKFKYFLLVYTLLVEFLERNTLKQAYKAVVGCRSIVLYLKGKAILTFIPVDIAGIDYRSRWRYICKNSKDCKIYAFIQFLDRQEAYAKFRCLYNNHNEYGTDKYLINTTEREFILVLLRKIGNPTEYQYWFKLHNQWIIELKKF